MDDSAAFRQAVQRMYGATNREERSSAGRWLEDWQKTPQAWRTADAVLHDGTSSDDEKYMASQTLRTKTQRDFEDLPKEAALSLRDSLITLLIRYGEGMKPVRTQLCIAIAALAVHLPASDFGEAGVLRWLMDTLARETNPRVAVLCLLEMLVMLPQEVTSNRLAVHPERRRQAEREMKTLFKQAVETLEQALVHSGETVLEHVLLAFAQWLQLTSTDQADCEALRGSVLVRQAFGGLERLDLFDVATDVIEELIWCTVRFADNMPFLKPGMDVLIIDIITHVLALRPRFQVARLRAENEAAGRDSNAGLPPEQAATASDDDDTVRGMVRLFLSTTEAYQALVVNGNKQMMSLLEAVLEVASHPEFDLAALTLSTIGKIAAAVHGTRPTEDLKRCYEQFVAVLSTRVRYPPNYVELSKDARYAFKRCRYEIEDVFRDTLNVLGAVDELRILVQPLQQQPVAPNPGEDYDWRVTEAAYFGIRALAGEGVPFCNPVMLEVFNSILKCPREPQLQFTACTLVRKFSSWYARSSLEDPSLLEKVPHLLNFVISGLGDHTSAGGAGLAFAALCTDCTPTLAGACRGDILGAFQQAIGMETWRHTRGSNSAGHGAGGGGGGAAAGAGGVPLEEEDVCSVVEGTAEVLAYAVHAGDAEASAQLTNCMLALLNPLYPIMGRCKSATHSGLPDDPDVRPAVHSLLHRAAVFFQHLKRCPAIVGERLPELWTFVVQLVSLAEENAVVETSMRVIIKALGSAAGHGADKWLPPILEHIPAAYIRTNCSAYLYLASHVIRSCATPTSPHRTEVARAVVPMVQHACSRLTSLADCNEHPDSTDDLFLMAFKGIVHAPFIFLDRTVLSALLQVTVVGLLVRQPEAFKSVQSFLYRLLDSRTLETAPDKAQMQATLQELMLRYGPTLVQLQMAGVVGACAENLLQDMALSLLQMMIATGHAGYQWLSTVLGALPEIAASAADRQKLVQTIQQASTVNTAVQEQLEQSIWSVKEALYEFSATCRRNPQIQSQCEKALAPQELWGDLGLNR